MVQIPGAGHSYSVTSTLTVGAKRRIPYFGRERVARRFRRVNVWRSTLPISIANDAGFRAESSAQLSNIRILLADDNAAFLDYVSRTLDADFQVIGRVADGDSVCSEVKKLKPDVIVLDISFGEYSGIDIALQLREQGYVGEIVFLTVHEDLDFVNAAIGAGGRGYVIKSRMNIDLELALTAVLAHQVFISPLRQD